MTKSLTFEEKLAKLEKITQQLEQGDVSLNQSLQAFKDGTALGVDLTKQLNDAKSKVKTAKIKMSNGSTRQFDRDVNGKDSSQNVDEKDFPF